MFASFIDFFYRHSRWTLVLTTVAVLFAAFEISKLSIELDLYEREVPDFQSTHDYQVQRQRFRDANSVSFIFDAGRAFSDRELCSIRDWIERTGAKPEIQSIASPFQLRSAVSEGTTVWYPLYLGLDCEKASDRPFALTELKKTPWASVSTSFEANDLGIDISFKDTEGASRFGKFDPRPIRAVYDDALTTIKIPNLKIYMAGSAAFRLHLKEALKHDFALQGLIFVIFLLVFRYVLGTWRSGVFFIGTVVVNLVLIYGLMSVFGQPLDLLTNNLTLMTAIAGVEDFLFVAMLMKLERVDWKNALKRMAAPCFFTTLTTFIGFVSLKTSDVALIGRFGLWAGLSMLIEWALFFILCPALFRHVPSLAKWVSIERAGPCGFLERLADLRAPRWASALSVIMFILGLYGMTRLTINEDPTTNFAPSHLNSKSFDYIEKTRGWRGAGSLVFEGEQIYSQRARIDAAIAEIRKLPNVVSVVSPFDPIDFAGFRLNSYLKQVSENDFRSTPLYRKFFSGDDLARGTIFFKSADLESLNTFNKRVRDVCNGFCKVVGQSAVYLEFSERIVPTLISSFGVSVALVIVVLLALSWYLKMPNKFALIYSAVWGPVTMMGLIAVFQIPVSLITSLFAAVVVGLTGDNAVQYLFAGSGSGSGASLERGMRERGAASVLLSWLLSLCSLVFLMESVKPMKILGLLFFIGFIVNLAGDLWLLKGLLPKTDKD